MKTYQLAKDTDHAMKFFGPLMTLSRAQFYQGEMEKAGFPVLVVNRSEGIDMTHGGKVFSGSKLTPLTN